MFKGKAKTKALSLNQMVWLDQRSPCLLMTSMENDTIAWYPGMEEKGVEPRKCCPNPQLCERINISIHVD